MRCIIDHVYNIMFEFVGRKMLPQEIGNCNVKSHEANLFSSIKLFTCILFSNSIFSETE